MKKLIGLTPSRGRRITFDEETGELEELIPKEQIRPGDILRVLPGEALPADGIILCGETTVDQSIITGESLPVDKTVGEAFFCGTINRFGSIDIRATKTVKDSSLQKLIRLVQEAEEKQAPMQRIADQCASWLVPAAMLIAILTGCFTQDMVRAVTVLVVFCPCALALATPTALMAAIGQAAKHGVIIKSGEALEKMGMVTTIAFDKTVTLTCGTLEVSDIMVFHKTVDKHSLLALAASAEAKSEHPLGRAIVAYAKEQGVPLVESGFFCGNEAYMAQHNIAIPQQVRKELEKVRAQENLRLS